MRLIAHVLSVVALTALLALCVSSPSPASAATAPQGRGYVPGPRLVPRMVVAQAAPASVKVKRGDSLSSLAARVYGSSKQWVWLWWDNRSKVRNPDMITPGEILRLSPRRPSVPVWLTSKALRALPRPAVVVVSHSDASTAPDAAQPSYAAPVVTYSGGSSYEQCVIARESGGNSQIMNASGHYGLFQFSFSTWVAYGGAPGEFGHATVAEQQQVFDNAMASGSGPSNWSPYDGCPVTAAADRGVKPQQATLMDVQVSAVKTKPAARSARAVQLGAYAWALAQRGKPYVWGGTGPYGFDCSGLVYAAYRAMAVTIPRTTYGMLAAAGYRLVRVFHPVAGDLAFFGSGHVELYVRPYWTFGAEEPGTLVGYHHWYPHQWVWRPTAYYAVRLG